MNQQEEQKITMRTPEEVDKDFSPLKYTEGDLISKIKQREEEILNELKVLFYEKYMNQDNEISLDDIIKTLTDK